MRKTLIAILLIASSATLIGGNVAKSHQEALLNTEHSDSLLAVWYDNNISIRLEKFFDEFIDIDTTINLEGEFADSIYISQLRKIVSPISLPYNDIVKRYILKYSSSKTLMSRMIGLSQYYFPMIEQELSNANIPIELRILPIIESALNPKARSRMGAVGLWQFTYTTGKAYGLEVTSFIDERCDPLMSTKAAAKYLNQLYRIFGDWTLALASYNCGPGNVTKAIRRAGGKPKSFWDIYPYLPRETRGYIPSFIAATYVFTYHKQLNINPIVPPMPLSTDTVMIDKLMHLEQVSSTLDIPIETIRSLNPMFKMDIIPAVDKRYSLTLPGYETIKFMDNRDSIFSKDSIYLKSYLQPDGSGKLKAMVSEKSGIVHKVKRGDTLGAIARKYGTTASQLARWNNLKSVNSTLRIGQRLHIYK